MRKKLFFLALLPLLFLANGARADSAWRVRQIMSGSENWAPADYTGGMSAIKGLGVSAVPELLKLLQVEDRANSLFYLCSALAVVPDMSALEGLKAKLSHKQWLVRSSCGEAYGIIAVHSKLDYPDLRPLARLIMVEPDVDCSVRSNVAREISAYGDAAFYRYFWDHLFQGSPCDRETAISGLSRSPSDDIKVGQAFLKIVLDKNEAEALREDAAWALTQFVYPPARQDIVGLLESGVSFGNFKSFLLSVMGKIGEKEDIPLLQTIVASDPHKGMGVWAVRGREAIEEIRKRNL